MVVLEFWYFAEGQDVSFRVAGKGSTFSLYHELFFQVVTGISSILSLVLVSSDSEGTGRSRSALGLWTLVVYTEFYYCAASSNMPLTIQGAK
jgi:hypothetical protein